MRQSVQETLNALLDAEADRLCRANKYERIADRAFGGAALRRVFDAVSAPFEREYERVWRG